MTTEELIKAAKELVELDGKRAEEYTFQDHDRFYNLTQTHAAKIARALVVAVEALEEYQKAFAMVDDPRGGMCRATKALAEIQKIAEGDQ